MPSGAKKLTQDEREERAWRKLEDKRIQEAREKRRLEDALGRQVVAKVAWKPEALVGQILKKNRPPERETGGKWRMRRWRQRDPEAAREADRRYRENNRAFYNHRKAEIMRLRRRLAAEKKAVLSAKIAT